MPAAPLIINGTLLLPDGASSVRLGEGPGHLVIDGGRIVHVDPARPSPAPDLGGEDCLITPAFTDTHVHLPQFDAIGVDGLELLDWLERAIFPAEMKWADTEYAAAMAKPDGDAARMTRAMLKAELEDLAVQIRALAAEVSP